jgi:hypothetical protein
MRRLLSILAAPLLTLAPQVRAQVAPDPLSTNELASAALAGVDVAAPTLGYAFDPEAQTLRAIEGVPGAATLGDPIALEARLAAVSVAPSRRFALARPAEGRQLLLIRLDGATAKAFHTGWRSGEISFSPSGTAVAILSEEGIDVWSGLPDLLVHVGTLRSPVETSRVALSDDGRAVAVLASGELWRLTPEGPQALFSGVRDIAFAANSHQLVAALAGRVISFAKLSQDDAPATLIEEMDGIERLSLSADGRLLVALNADHGITVADLSTSARSRIAGPESAGSLMRAQGDAVFQLAADSSGEIWLLDAGGPSPRIVSVQKRSDQ